MTIRTMMLAKDGLQTRVALDEATVTEYADAMRDGAKFPPVTVYADNGKYWLADGFHRVEAATRAGKAAVEAEVRRGTFKDALLCALGANANHGLRRSNADKRRALEIAWERKTELFGEIEPSNELLAKVCSVSRQTVINFVRDKQPVKILQVEAPRQGVKILHPDTPAEAPVPALPKAPRRVLGLDGKVRTVSAPKAPVRPSMPVRPSAPAHVVPVDRFGVEIPVAIGGAFGEDVLSDVLSSISAARCALRRGFEEKAAQFAAVRQDALVQLDNAYSFVKSALPFCVCRMCQGQGCKACHGRGWQTEEEYGRNPKEFKAEAGK